MSILPVAALAVLIPVSGGAQTKAPAHRPPAHRVPALPDVPLPADPGLYAVIYTSMGNIVCRLFDQDAPKTVANFRGLATGTKAWTDPQTGKQTRRPLYSGVVFHRVIPNFMIQGGDPLGQDPERAGTGDPGFKFEDEIEWSRTFDHPGILAMANSGPNTNGSQFFITVAPTPWLNGHHTIFGEVVSGQDVADKISQVPKDERDRPTTAVKITRITVRQVRAPAAGKPAALKPATPSTAH